MFPNRKPGGQPANIQNCITSGEKCKAQLKLQVYVSGQPGGASQLYHSSHLVVAGLQTSLSPGRPGSQGLQGSAPSVASSPASLQQLPAQAPSSCGTTIPALEPVTLCNCSCCCYSRKPLPHPQTESSDATNISHSLCVGTAADGSTTAAR